MSVIQYPHNSAYFATPQTSWHISSYAFRPIPPDTGDVLITLTETYTHRPDRLSFDLYRTPSYWWVFSIRNPALRSDPIWGFVAGVQLYIPSADYIRRVLGS